MKLKEFMSIYYGNLIVIDVVNEIEIECKNKMELERKYGEWEVLTIKPRATFGGCGIFKSQITVEAIIEVSIWEGK